MSPTPVRTSGCISRVFDLLETDLSVQFNRILFQLALGVQRFPHRQPLGKLFRGLKCHAADHAGAKVVNRNLGGFLHIDFFAALQGATQVRSTQWLDAQGQLRDASSFRSGMEVRGVQVLSYSRDSSGQAQAKLNSPRPAKDTERAQGEAGNPSEASCTVPGHLRQVLSLSTVFEPGPLAAIHTQVRQQIATQWLSANENPWRMVALTEP